MQATRGCGCRRRRAQQRLLAAGIAPTKNDRQRLSLQLTRGRSDGLPYSRCHSAETRQRSSAAGRRSLFSRTRETRSSPACQSKLRSSEDWWSQTGSNRRPPACKAGALPTELWPRLRLRLDYERRTREPWWAWEDLNFRPHAYQARALTN